MAQKINKSQTPNINRQENTTNNDSSGTRIECGIGVISGSSAKIVTFSQAFTEIPVVIATNAGGNTASAAYAYPSVGGVGGQFTDRTISAVGQSTTQFRAIAAGTAPTGSQNITFTWIAIGR